MRKGKRERREGKGGIFTLRGGAVFASEEKWRRREGRGGVGGYERQSTKMIY